MLTIPALLDPYPIDGGCSCTVYLWSCAPLVPLPQAHLPDWVLCCFACALFLEAVNQPQTEVGSGTLHHHAEAP